MKRIALFLYIGIILVAIYFPWLDLQKALSSGDWPYLYSENIAAFKIFPETSFIWLEPYYNLTAKIGVQFFNLSWEVIEKIFWFYPFILISIFSSAVFVGHILKVLQIGKFREFLILIGCLVFTTNTYILMIVGGGQMGVAMAYALSPLVLYSYFKLLETKKLTVKKLVLFSLASAFTFMFDPRLFMITNFLILIHFALDSFIYKQINVAAFKKLTYVNILAFVLNLFWIIPNVFNFSGEYLEAANEANASFLSFATFPNTISLLHPNWPENIFGKIGFMKPEFLIITAVVFLPLFLIDVKDKNKKVFISFFLLAGILGSFMAKGVGDPFSGFYLFISNIPGSALFRDPTKFYLWICLSYSVLFPLGVYYLLDKFLNNKKKTQILFLSLIVFYLLFLVSPAIGHRLTGTFSPQVVPNDYIVFKDFITTQKDFSSVLWMPEKQRFTFSSDIHAALSARKFIEVGYVTKLSENLLSKEAKEFLKQENIKYVAVPYDSKGEIFMYDRKYDEKLYRKTIEDLRKVPYLVEMVDENGKSRFGKIVVFEVRNL